ncbi:phosphotransferase [Ferrimicrobium sp.]|uniref:phosphotransferase enzyme family protein n=1 Tax=Ferrimicrobium sp. TaxID=2926050 RepID=UPI00261B47F6|nr:phosphotransferase [Ferrimicrobium sp.]
MLEAMDQFADGQSGVVVRRGMDLSTMKGAQVERVSDCEALVPLDELASSWPCLAGSRVLRMERSENTTWLVVGPGGKFAVRRYRDGYQDVASIRAELRFMRLAKEALPVQVPGVILTRFGDELLSLFDRLYVVFTYVQGQMATQGQVIELASQIGELAALVHLCADDSDRTLQARWSWDASVLTGPAPRWGPWQPAFSRDPRGYEVVAAAHGEIGARLDSAPRGGSVFGLLHADLRAANLFVQDDRLTGIIDFDDCGYGWYAYEAVASLSFYEASPEALGLLRGWLVGYGRIRALGSQALALVPRLLMYRRLLLTGWLLEHPHVRVPEIDRSRFGADTVRLATRYLVDPQDIERLLGE